MINLLQQKYDEINAAKTECNWYLVKHNPDFSNQCFYVYVLNKYQKLIESGETPQGNFKQYIEDQIRTINAQKGLNIPINYRMMRVAAFLGLIRMTSSTYANAEISQTFKEINALCNGEFFDTVKYQHIIDRQLEKMFVSTNLDEEFEGVRSEFELFPVMLLYKVLLELGQATGKYQVTTGEYFLFVTTTKKYRDFLDTLLQIKLYRTVSDADKNEFDALFAKIDSRVHVALKQLSTLEIAEQTIKIKPEKISEVAKKVTIFEENTDIFNPENYFEFLCSTDSIEDLIREKQIRHANHSGENILLYGVPGAGKSHYIAQKYIADNDEEHYERVVFHPEYSYSDFVGQIMPVQKNKENSTEKYICYEFVPGPFTRMLQRCKAAAATDDSQMFYLIIEEINRGNAPGIFGDIFQLLDRNPSGESRYAITNFPVAEYVYGDSKVKIKLPGNLTLLATMNTADQSVFTLDTAFKRRWHLCSIENNVSGSKLANFRIGSSDVTWGSFASKINDLIELESETCLSTEDKRLGAYFVSEYELMSFSAFGEKVLMYLWNDVFQFNRDHLFKQSYRSLEKLLADFKITGFSEHSVFNDNIAFERIVSETSEVQEENNNAKMQDV